MNNKSFNQKIKEYIISITGGMCVANPISSARDIFVVGLSNSISLESRLKTNIIYYGGMGYLYLKGRDFLQKKFNKNESYKKRILIDSIYGMSFNTYLDLFTYLSSGATIKETLISIGTKNLTSFITSPLITYGIDISKDLTGIKEFKQLPKFLRNKKHKKKYACALLTCSILLNSSIYFINHVCINNMH